MNVEDLVAKARSIRTDLPDNEIALFNNSPGEWRIDFGNPYPHIALGESWGLYVGRGATYEAAFEDLFQKLEAGRSAEVIHQEARKDPDDPNNFWME